MRISRSQLSKTLRKKFRWRRPRHTLKGRHVAAEAERVGPRLQLRRQQAEAGDIVLLYGDESEARQAGMPCRPGVVSDVTRQQPRCPKLVRISHLLGLLAGQRHHPCAGTVRNRRILARPGTVAERRHHAKPRRPIKASLHGLMGYADHLTNCVGPRVGVIGQEDPCPLNPTGPFRSRPCDRLKFGQLSRFDRDPCYPAGCCHADGCDSTLCGVS